MVEVYPPIVLAAGFAEVGIFVVLAGLHFFWAIGGKLGGGAAIPEKDGKPLFTPGRGMTILVGLALLLCALIIAGKIGLFGSHQFLQQGFTVGTSGIALVFGLRAIGDFRYVGFFKKHRNGRFAHWDYVLFSPLCTLISGFSFMLVLG